MGKLDVAFVYCLVDFSGQGGRCFNFPGGVLPNNSRRGLGGIFSRGYRVLGFNSGCPGLLRLAPGNEPGDARPIHGALFDRSDSTIADQISKLAHAKLLSIRRRGLPVDLGSGFGQGEAGFFFIGIRHEHVEISFVLLKQALNMPKFLGICGKQIFLILDSGLEVFDARIDRSLLFKPKAALGSGNRGIPHRHAAITNSTGNTSPEDFSQILMGHDLEIRIREVQIDQRGDFLESFFREF